MCITNDDAISNGNKCNNVMAKKCLKKGKENQKERNDNKVITIEERKETKNEKQLE